MKYDDASWHYGGDFPKDLPNEAGATHIGMFVAWALLSRLASSVHTEEFPEELDLLQRRQITPGQFFLRNCDGKFTDEDLDPIGNEFVRAYFETNRYLLDYEEVLGSDLPSLYHVEDSWENYDRLCPRLDQRFAAWNRKRTLKSLIWWRK